MSYINDALRKAQRERDGRYERFGDIIAPCLERSGQPRKRRLAIGAAITLLVLIPAGESTDGLTITFASTPDPPHAGANTFDVTVTQADGAPLADATVTTVFSMPAMPAMNMPAMRSEATLQHDADGRYRGTGQLSMGGTWNVAVKVVRGSEELASRQLSIVVKQ